jgi:hypothetical protein
VIFQGDVARRAWRNSTSFDSAGRLWKAATAT